MKGTELNKNISETKSNMQCLCHMEFNFDVSTDFFGGGLKCISGLLYSLSFFSMQTGWNNFTYYAALYFMTWTTFGFISASIMYLLMLFKVIIYVFKLSWTTSSVFLIAICCDSTYVIMELIWGAWKIYCSVFGRWNLTLGT